MSSTYNTSSNKRTKLMKSNQSCAAMTKAMMLPEILQLIFGYLDPQTKGRVARVSWLWNDVMAHPRMWHNVTVGFMYKESNYLIGPVDLTFDLDYYDYWRRFVIIQPSCQKFPQLTKLFVVKTSENSAKMLRAIVCGFQNLVSLHMSYILINDVGLALIADGLKSLRHLNLDRCDHITDIGMAALCGWNGVTCSGNVPTLLTLSIKHGNKLTDDTFKFLGSGQIALETLSLSYCSGITDIGLQFLTSMEKLNILKLFFCLGIDDKAMAHLAKMKNLINLNLGCTNITAAGLTVLASGVPRLASLELYHCKEVNDKSAHSLTCLDRMTHLIHLGLRGTSIGDSMLECLALMVQEHRQLKALM